MQATIKPPQSASILSTKTNRNTNSNLNAQTNNTNCSAPQQTNIKSLSKTKDNKSVAQRVMDVTATGANTTATNTSTTTTTPTTTPTTTTTTTNNNNNNSNNNNNNNNINNNNAEVRKSVSYQLQQAVGATINADEQVSLNKPGASILKMSSSSADSCSGLDNDSEVETLTNRASKRDISPTQMNANNNKENQQQPKFNDLNNNIKLNKLSNSNSNSWLHGESATISTQQKQQQHLLAGDQQTTRISLDTKVPHPLEHENNNGNNNNFAAATRFSSSSRIEEEVSYYNDAQINDCRSVLVEPKQVGGSLDNNTKPKLLAASQNQRNTYNTNKTTATTNMQQSSDSCQHLLKQQHHNNNVPNLRQTFHITPSQVTKSHMHQHECQLASYMSSDVFEDDSNPEYESRYDNALVEKRIEIEARRNRSLQQAAEQQQQLLLSSSSTTTSATTGHSVCISTSPKAKSAPVTPCNVTPTAFHQKTSHLSTSRAGSGCNPANTLPHDIRKNITATCRVLPSSLAGLSNSSTITTATTTVANCHQLDELIEQGEHALHDHDYTSAIHLFSRCIDLATNNQNVVYLKRNFKIYSQRAEAHFNLANYNEAIDDSRAARELNPKWTQAYYLQGKSQLAIGQYTDSLAVFSFGLTQDPNDKRLFEALVDAALNCTTTSFRTDFELKYNKLKSHNLDKRPSIVVSLLGQELLAKGHSEHAAIVLESALKLNNLEQQTSGGNNSILKNQKKFKSSLLSSIALAYSMMKDHDKAVACMLKEYAIEEELEDANGQCRVLSNLGFTYYKMRKFDKSLEAHRDQMKLALKAKLFQQAGQALNALGHVHVARNSLTDALTSHTRCLDILQQLDDNYYNQFKELLSIGHIHAMLGDYNSASEKYNEAIKTINNCRDKFTNQDELTSGSIMVYFNMAYLALKKHLFNEAKQHYGTVIKATKTLTNQTKATLFEMRASHGMGQACRLFKKFDEAREWFERQLELAKSVDNIVGQSQALCCLGMIHQHYKEYQEAWRLFDENLKLVDNMSPILKAYAHSYLASAYFTMNRFNEAKLHYETSISLFKSLDHCTAEEKTLETNLDLVKRRMSVMDLNATAACNNQSSIKLQ